MYGEHNLLMKDPESEDYSLDYLKRSFQDESTRERYKNTTEKMVKRFKDGDSKILKKWLYFNEYVMKTARKYEY